MKKLALLFLMGAFVLGLNAQTFTPAKELRELPKSNAIGVLEPGTSVYMMKAYESVGWVSPYAFLRYLLPTSYNIESKAVFVDIFPDSCLNYVWQYPDSLNEFCVWRHSFGSSFDPYSESFDKVFQAGIFPTPDSPPVLTYPYSIDTVLVAATYRWGEKDGYDTLSPDTLRLYFSYYEVYKREKLQKEWYALHYTSDVHQDTALFSPIITFDPQDVKQSKGNSLRPIASNTVTVDYILQRTDSTRVWDSIIEGETHQYFSYRNIKIPVTIGNNGFEVPAGAVVSCIVKFIPGFQYHVGDTLRYGKVKPDDTFDGTPAYYHNTFSLKVYSESNQNAKHYCDPYGYNGSFFEHRNTHYQLWTTNGKPNTLYNSMYYPTHQYVPSITYHMAYDSLAAVEVADSSKFRKIGIKEANSVIESIYPNPANSMVTVSLKNERPATIRIYNVMGQEVKRVYANEQKTTISIKDLSAGMYIISVEQNGKRFNSKLTVQ